MGFDGVDDALEPNRRLVTSDRPLDPYDLRRTCGGMLEIEKHAARTPGVVNGCRLAR